MPRLETTIESHFCRRMEDYGWLNDKLDAAAEKKAGNQDRVFWGYGAFVVFVEFKRDEAPKKRRGQKLQAWRRAQLRKRGFACYVAVGKLQAERVFAQINGPEAKLYGVRTKR